MAVKADDGVKLGSLQRPTAALRIRAVRVQNGRELLVTHDADGSLLVVLPEDGTVLALVDEAHGRAGAAAGEDGPGHDWDELSPLQKAFFQGLKGDEDLLELMDAFSRQFERNEAEHRRRMDHVSRSIENYWRGREDQRPDGK